MSKRALVEDYLNLLETFSTDDRKIDAIVHPEIEQIEYPNLLNRRGQKSDLADLKRRMAIGKQILAAQKYIITGYIENGDRVAVEAKWQATMAIDAPPFKKGQNLRAFFCITLDFQDGRIIRQQNYDCFEEF